MNLQDIIRKIVRDETEVYSQPCEVLAVDQDARTIDVRPYNNEAEIYSVRLQSSESQSVGYVSFPKIGSAVIVTFLSKDLAFCSLMTEIDSIKLNVNDYVEINSKSVIFNDGKNGALAISSKLTDEYNKIIQDINALKSALSGFVPVPSDGGAALKAVLSSYFSQQLQVVQENNIVNKDITH